MKIDWKSPTLPLRIALTAILVMHSIPSLVSGNVNGFGTEYLAPLGFGVLGLPLAWAIKLSHLAAIVSLWTKKWIQWLGGITILILLAGIVLVHAPHGWFVVGGGFNGVEFNVLLIAAFAAIMISDKRT